MQKTEEESIHLTSELCDKAVVFLPIDLKEIPGGFNQPVETDECLAKTENMQGASANGVETASSVCEGNAEVSKGESFLISPDTAKVASETCEMSKHSEVNETPFKAEKTPEDEKHKENGEYEVKTTEEEAGTVENEVKTTEDSLQKGDRDCDIANLEETGLTEKLEESNLDIGGEKRVEDVVVIADQDASLVEEKSCSQEIKHEGIETDENADIKSNKEVHSIPEADLELEKQASIDATNPIDSLKANESVPEVGDSNLVQEVPEEKSSVEVKDTEPEKLPVLQEKEDGTETIKPIETSENQEASDEVKKDEECTVPVPEGSISEENIDVLKPSQEGNSEKEEILKESFQQQNELEKEKPECPLNEDVNTAISSENEETSTSIKEVASIEEHVEKSEGEVMEDTPTNTVAVSENAQSTETDTLQTEVKENTESAQVEIPNKNADDEIEKQSEKCSETNEAIENKQQGEEACTAETPEIETRGVISEKDVTEEGRGNTEQDETKECNEKKTVIAEEDSEQISPENEAQQDLEQSSYITTKETETHTSKADEIPSPVEQETVQNLEETTENEEKIGEKEDESTKDNGIEKEVETITKEYELESKEQAEPKDAVENNEENLKKEETEEVCEGPEPTIKEESAITNDTEKSTEEEMHTSVPEKEKEEIPEVEVCDKLETNNTVEDAEKQIVEEDTNKDQPTQLTETVEEKSEEASNSKIEETDSTEEKTLQTSEETEEPNNDPSLLDTVKESDEITPREIKEEILCRSSAEPEESKKDTEEETSVKESINTVDVDSASTAAETEETNEKAVEAEEEREEIKDVAAVEKNGLETTEQSSNITPEETEMHNSKADEIPSPVEQETVQNLEETTENEEKIIGEKEDESTKDNGTEKEEVETITKEYELESKEQAEPKDSVENNEENLKKEETEEACEGPEPTIKEESAITDDTEKSTEEEMHTSVPEKEKEEIPEVEVCDKLEIKNTVEDAEKQIVEEDTNKDQPTQLIETVEEKSEEASNSKIEETDSTEEEKTLQTSEEKEEPNNDPSLLDTVKESNEITPREIKEEIVCSSSAEPEESKKDTEEETSVKGSIDTADVESASTAAETEETNKKEVEAEEKMQEINDVAVEKDGLETTEQEGTGVDSADVDVKPADSISCEKDKEVPQEEEGMQDEVPNAGSEDQLETTAKEIPSKEILGDETKEVDTVPSEEYEPTPSEERKLSDETSEKDQVPCEDSETPVAQATDDILIQKEVESEDSGKQSGHDENLAEKCTSESEVIDVSKMEESRELENQSDACESKTSQDEQSSDLGLESEKTNDGKPLDEVTDLGEISSTCKDGEKAIQEEENLAKPESLKEDAEVEKEETGLVTEAHDQMSEAVNDAKNVELEPAVFEEKFKSESETVAEHLSREVIPETSTDVQNQETEEQIKEEPEDKLEDKDCINKEENADEVTKAVILSEEVNEEVKKAEETEESKEHVIEEEDKGIKEHEETEKSVTAEELNENEVEETKGAPETSSNYISQGVETTVEADISSPNTLPEEKEEEQLQTSASTLPSEDEEEIKTANPVEKTEEEIQKDAEVVKQESLEDTSDKNTTEEVCLQEVEQRELEAVAEEETVASQGLEKEEPEEQIQTTSSTLPSEEREHGTGETTEETECDKTKEEVPAKLDVATADETTAEQTLTADKSEEGTTSSALLPNEQEVETLSTVQKIEEENIKEVGTPDIKISEDSSGAKETEEISTEKEECQALEDTEKDETPAAQTLQAEEAKDEPLTSSSILPSEDLKHENIAKVDQIEEEKVKEVGLLEREIPQEPEAVVDHEIAVAQASITEEPTTVDKLDTEETKEAEKLENENYEGSSAREMEEICLPKEEPNDLHAVPKEELTSGQTSSEEKSDEHISGSAITCEEPEHETEKIEDEKTNEEEITKDKSPEDASDAKTVEEICSQKERSIELEAVVEDETTADLNPTEKKLEEQVENPTSALPSKEEELVSTSTSEKIESEKTEEAECLQKEQPQEGEALATSTLPSEEQEDERKETELQEDENPEKIPEETSEKVPDNELITKTEDVAIEEKLVKERDEARDEENQGEKVNEGDEIILNEVSKEEVVEDKEVTETSYSTPLSEEQTKESCGGDELKDEQVNDKTNEAFETTTCQNEELTEEAQKSSESEIVEKQIVCEDKSVEVPGEVAVAATTETEEEPRAELSQAEGTKDIGESNEISGDIQQSEETTKASDKQIPRELDPAEITDITSSIEKEDVPVDLKDSAAESSEKAEVHLKVEEVQHGGEYTNATNNLSEEITQESMAVEDSTKVSLSDQCESLAEETVQVAAQGVIEEREAEGKTDAAQILVEKPEEESLPPPSKFPSEEGEHGVTTKVDAVEETEPKEVEILDKETSDTKTGGEICFKKEENKEFKADEQDIIAVQTPTELKEDKELAEPPVSKFEDVNKEDEEKDKYIREETKETLKAPACETQNEELLVETQKVGEDNNIEKGIIVEDKSVKEPEQASLEEDKTVKVEVPGESDPVESTGTVPSIGKEQSIEQHDRALEIPDKVEVRELEPGNAQEVCSEPGADLEEQKKTENSGVEVTQEPASADSAKSSLSDLLKRATEEKMGVAKDVIQERELTVSKEEAHVEEETVQVKEAKTDEEKEECEEGDEHNKADSGSDAPVMVEAPRDAETKPHKKSHNILSGVGSKVKHSISKVKKAITGKSSSKEPKPTSPKEKETEKC
ncbi:hypothetical protein COLO4_29109 [Corchorus olitorius]|uniref:Uncharacterized protein n=1 Tax=Corchorus olitorius TaxID=93759 RepID=A0A1R3HGD5_9ROSI|nr:hypothetical protein COLO4_29109 [Corchorus olitorius]